MQDTQFLTKTDQAYQRLRRDILSAHLRPGAPLKLKTLLEEYDVGWTPLREALTRLEAEKLVTMANNRGFAVAPVSQAELADLTHARMVVEIPLLIESIQYGDEDWESRVVTAHYRLSRCKPSPSGFCEKTVEEWEQRHSQFHNALLSAAKSNWLQHFQAVIWDQLRRHQRVLSLAPTLRAAAIPDQEGKNAVNMLQQAMSLPHHTELMNAALNRDIELARKLMTEHIGYTLDVYQYSNTCI